MINVINKLFYIFTYTVILFTFSERIFWNYYRPDVDTLKNLITGLILYFFLTYALAYLIHRYSINSLTKLTLAGLIYALLAEVVIAGMVVANPFSLPISIPWHTVIAVLGGLYFVPKYLAEKNRSQKIKAVLLSTIIYVLWSFNWTTNEIGANYTYQDFLINTIIVIFLLTLGYYSISLVKKIPEIRFNRIDASILVIFFSLFPIIHYGIYTPIILSSLAVLIYFLIQKIKSETENNLRGNILNNIPNLSFSFYFYIWFSLLATLPLALCLHLYNISFSTFLIIPLILIYLKLTIK